MNITKLSGMCFFYSLPKKAKEIKKRYNKQLSLFDDKDFEGKYLIKGFEHQKSNFIITKDSIQLAHWGLIPFWSKPEHADLLLSKSSTVNAQEEDIFKKSSWRVPIKHHRCLVPAIGWYEYHYENEKVKDVYFIFVKDMEIFSFAGIYDIWKDPDSGKEITTYSVITSPANERMKFIHNGGAHPFRMPVILHKKDEEKWLDPNTTDEELKAIMQPFPDQLMGDYIIDYIPKEFRGADPYNDRLLIKQ